MKHVITRHDNKIEIQVTGIGDDTRLFDGVHDCRSVRERCGEENYTTLDSLTVQLVADGVRFELRARTDARLDLDEAEQCLDNTMGQILERNEKATLVA